MKKILILVNSPLFVIQHLMPILNILKQKSELIIFCPFDKKFKIDAEGFKIQYINIRRDPSILDLYTLIVFTYFRLKLKPNYCLSFTPKAGLINALSFFFLWN